MTTLKTLERGLQALQVIGSGAEGMTVARLAQELDVDRAVAHRIVATLESGGMATRGADGVVRLGPAVLALARSFTDRGERAQPRLLAELAERCHATAFVAMADGAECLVVQTAEPSGTLVRVGYRVGVRHPLTLGAAGLAILAASPPVSGESEEVTSSRLRGYASATGQLIPGAQGLAVGFRRFSSAAGLWERCSVGVVAMGHLDLAVAKQAVEETARELGEVPQPGE